MPIIKSRNKLVYFAHIPKCAGTSVEDYLIKTCKSVSFLDREFLIHDTGLFWSKSSPQHVDGQTVARFFKSENFFDLHFTIVRDPIKRFVSAFKFNKYHNKFDELKAISINEYVASLTTEKINSIGYMDNHFLPMFRFLIPGRPFYVFRMESDLDALEHWLKKNVVKRFSRKASRKRIKHSNASEGLYSVEENLSLSPESIDKIKFLYRRDFELFSFDDMSCFSKIITLEM